MSEQLQLQLFTEPKNELTDLIRDMWRCIQVSPLAPPALKQSIKERIDEHGIEVDE